MATNMQEIIAYSVRDRRKALGMSQRELAEAVGFGSHQIVSELERGQRDVKAWELARIADALHTSLPALLKLGRAKKTERHVFWRTDAPEADRCKHEAKLLERFDRYRRVEELTNAGGDTQALPQLSVDRSTSFGQTEQLASSVRRSMDLGGRPAMSLAETLQERFGVMLFLDDLGNGETACVRTESNAAILLNRNDAPWRRRFSLAHELFHLVMWDAVMESWPHHTKWPDQVEKLANAFAAALLLPGDDLRAEFQSRYEERDASNWELLCVARAYGVSTEALLWRLQRLDLMTEEAVCAKLDDPESHRTSRASMVGRWFKPPPDLPERFVRLVLRAYGTGDLSRSVVAKYLEKDPGELWYLDWGFASAIANTKPAFRRLVGMDPFRVDERPSPVPVGTAGVYVLSEPDRPLYVGRTRNLRNRLSGHCSSSVNRATLAVKMARIGADRDANYKGDRSAKYLYENDLNFRAEFDKARQRIGAMQVRYVAERDDVGQALLEIYAAVELDTLLRVGSEAGRSGGYNSFRTS